MYVESDSGKYIPAGGDEFKNKMILMCTLELDELMAMFRVVNQREEEAELQPWLSVGEADDEEEKLIVSDSGAKFLFAGLPAAMHRVYGDRFNERALSWTGVDSLLIQETFYVSSKGMKQPDFATGGAVGDAFDVLFGTDTLIGTWTKGTGKGGPDLRNSGVFCVGAQFFSLAMHSLTRAERTPSAA